MYVKCDYEEEINFDLPVRKSRECFNCLSNHELFECSECKFDLCKSCYENFDLS
jgi:hypothetical protein